MKPEACLEVANKSRKQAELYFKKGNVGRAFAHFLVALKLRPAWKAELSQQFVSALCIWGEQLDQQQRYKDLFTCYEQALEVFPDSVDVLNNLGSHLYRWGHTLEACNYFRQAVVCNPGYLPAVHNLRGCCNLLVERWHYRMLNDSVRNDAYRAAITRRVQQHGSGSTVLDIGTGTGLLSLFAAEAGAEQVFACDYSPAMIHIASQVVEANAASKRVNLINKMSSDIVIPTDIPARVSLVVTETVDAGLLGEGILQSFIHAWENLLISLGPPHIVRVVPQAATVWMVPVECLHIARKYHVLETDFAEDEMQIEDEIDCQQKGFDFSKLPLVAKRGEPYDTEDLNMVPGGYRFLAKPCNALQVRFDDCDDMKKWMNGQNEIQLCFDSLEPGRVDAIVAWFDLSLDDIVTLSSTPCAEHDDDLHKASCWDQAVFPVQHPLLLKQSDKLMINVLCNGGKISANVSECKQSDGMDTLEQALHCSTISSDSVIPHNICITAGRKEARADTHDEDIKEESEMILNGSEGMHEIPQEAVRFLNDGHWMDTLKKTAKYLSLKVQHDRVCSVLDLCPFPVLGLHLLKSQDVRVTCVASSATAKVIKRLSVLNSINANRIQCVDEECLSEFLQQSGTRFDVVMVHMISQAGELKENVLDILPLLRSSLAVGGIMLPKEISVWGQLLESDWLKQVSHVLDNSRTCGFNIAPFINIYQVPQHLDLNLSSLEAVFLSSWSKLLDFSLDTDPSNITKTASVQATCSGKANALGYWYNILIHEAVPSITTLHSSSHVSQVAVLFEPSIAVSKEQTVELQIRFYQGDIYIEPLQNEEQS